MSGLYQVIHTSPIAGWIGIVIGGSAAILGIRATLAWKRRKQAELKGEQEKLDRRQELVGQSQKRSKKARNGRSL